MKRKQYNTKIESGHFLEIKNIEFEFVKSDLNQNITIITQNKEEIERENHFQIKLDVKLLHPKFIEELGLEIKNILGLSFVPYDYKNKSFNFYSNKNHSEEIQKEKLLSLFNIIKEKEILFKEFTKDSITLHENDILNKFEYEDHDVALKINSENNTYLMCVKKYLGGDYYKLFASNSTKIINTNQDSIHNEMFANIITKKGNTIFEISKYGYAEIKDYIKYKIKEKNNYIKNQSELLDKTDRDLIANFEKENIFGLKVKYDENLKMFEFYCKGYFENRYEGVLTERGCISKLALNYILTKDEDKIKEADKLNYINEYEIYKEKLKYSLHFLDVSIRKEKKLYLPLEYNNILKEIINNYDESFWGRKEEKIKIQNQQITTNNSKFPTVYFDKNSQAYLIYTVQQKSSKKENEINQYLYLKGIKLSYEESLVWLNNEHKEIYENSLYLNTDVWTNINGKPQINKADRLTTFDSILLNIELMNKTMQYSKTNKTKIKKL